jgi:hypothetical protein
MNHTPHRANSPSGEVQCAGRSNRRPVSQRVRNGSAEVFEECGDLLVEFALSDH